MTEAEIDEMRAENVRLNDLCKFLVTALEHAAECINRLQDGEPEGLTSPHDDPDISAMVYFIASEASGNIKIGSSTQPKSRLDALQTAADSPLRLLGTTPGGRRLERSLHRQFSHLRIRANSEWFRPGDDLLDHIKTSCVSP